METIMGAILNQPGLNPEFKKVVEGPVYYETLPETATTVRDEIDQILREYMPHNLFQDHPDLTDHMVDELEHLVNREVLDKADQIVRRLQKHIGGE